MENNENENKIGGLSPDFNKISSETSKKVGKEAAKKAGKAAGKAGKLAGGPVGWIISAVEFFLEKPKTVSSIFFILALISSIVLILFYTIFSYFPKILLSFNDSYNSTDNLYSLKESIFEKAKEVEEEEILKKIAFGEKKIEEYEKKEDEEITNILEDGSIYIIGNKYTYKEEVKSNASYISPDTFPIILSRYNAIVTFNEEIEKSYDSFLEKVFNKIKDGDKKTLEDYEKEADGFYERLRTYLNEKIEVSDVFLDEAVSENTYVEILEINGEETEVTNIHRTFEIKVNVELTLNTEIDFLEDDLDILYKELLENRNKSSKREYTQEEIKKEIEEFIEYSLSLYNLSFY